MVIGIDIDNTIQDCESFLNEYGVPYFKKDRDLTKYFDTDCFDVHKYEWLGFWSKHISLYNLEGKCFEGAAEKISYWKKLGHKIVIITARGNEFFNIDPEKEMKETKIWLKKNNIEYDDIYFVKEKGKIVRELGVGIMLEDSVRQIENIRNWSPSTRIYMKNTPFNQNFHGDVKRFDSFYEIEL